MWITSTNILSASAEVQDARRRQGSGLLMASYKHGLGHPMSISRWWLASKKKNANTMGCHGQWWLRTEGIKQCGQLASLRQLWCIMGGKTARKPALEQSGVVYAYGMIGLSSPQACVP
uniref:Uncharacterized protein n=1 Tax=Chlamydomonas euryale TaxID=1486919 RepID=A0A7R9V509_9CHLO|mmetsp:Transcript_16253/g.48402  ORF Transcript_16253/g.48402 Transcript_16253/m.48402 type:complete len:118 (+) Transcript_16253:134-487(+)